ncbi:MAG: hypothetical protein JST80_09625 [Bdellovibrionales bacterium]|nr:hypothetical protein [Bdellovibrionales bacterium]
MNNQKISFVNQTSNERITVADFDSAAVLADVLKEVSIDWVVEGQERERPAPVIVAPIASIADVTPLPVILGAAKEEKHGKEFRVILISGTSTFRCGTCSASMEEVVLKNVAPEAFQQKQCTAYISHKDMSESIEVTCKVMTNASGECHLKFVKSASSEMKRWSEWMSESVAS